MPTQSVKASWMKGGFMNARSAALALGFGLAVAGGIALALFASQRGSEGLGKADEPYRLEALKTELGELEARLEGLDHRIAELESRGGGMGSRRIPVQKKGKEAADSETSRGEEPAAVPRGGEVGAQAEAAPDPGTLIPKTGPGAKTKLAEANIVDLLFLAGSGDREALKEIVGRLGHRDGRTRRDAVRGLAYLVKRQKKSGDPVDSGLVRQMSPLVEDPDYKVREEVAKTFKLFDPADVAPHLDRLLDDTSSDVVCEAVESLEDIGWRDALPRLSHISQSSDLDVAYKTAVVLRKWGDDSGADSVIARLAAGLSSPNARDRRRTVDRIRRIGGSAALATLRAAARDPDPEVRARAEKAIERLEKDLSRDR
jgi:hypothetical protein